MSLWKQQSSLSHTFKCDKDLVHVLLLMFRTIDNEGGQLGSYQMFISQFLARTGFPAPFTRGRLIWRVISGSHKAVRDRTQILGPDPARWPASGEEVQGLHPGQGSEGSPVGLLSWGVEAAWGAGLGTTSSCTLRVHSVSEYMASVSSQTSGQWEKIWECRVNLLNIA